MQLGIPYAKTALGRAYLNQPATPGSRARRSVLIMMDGRKTVRSLMPAIRSLGMRTADVQALVAQGFLAPSLAIEQMAPPDLELTQPPRQVVESKSLVVAKLFALDLLARMLDPQDTDWADKAGTRHARCCAGSTTAPGTWPRWPGPSGPSASARRHWPSCLNTTSRRMAPASSLTCCRRPPAPPPGNTPGPSPGPRIRHTAKARRGDTRAASGVNWARVTRRPSRSITQGAVRCAGAGHFKACPPRPGPAHGPSPCSHRRRCSCSPGRVSSTWRRAG